MLKSVVLAAFMFFLVNVGFSQENIPQVDFKITRISSLFNFLNYAKEGLPSNHPMVNLIYENYGNDPKFNELVDKYAQLRLNYSYKRSEYPKMRYSSFSSYELIWLAAAKSSDIENFKDRIIGILPMDTYFKFISILTDIDPYHDKLIWQKVKDDNTMILLELDPFKNDILRAFFKIRNFYGTVWDPDVPLTTVLLPLPFERSYVSGFANGHILVSEYLTKREKDYISRVEVIIHEMCHVLFNQQSPQFQRQIDAWFRESNSDYSGLAYSFINEGLATAIGNGWAHKEIFGNLPPLPWYNDPYISNYAHELYPIISEYLDKNLAIDKKFVDSAIKALEEKFPDSIYDPIFLLNETHFYASLSSKNQIEDVNNVLRKYLKSGWYHVEMDSEFLQVLKINNLTKVFLIDSKESNSGLIELNNIFKELNINTPFDTIDILKDDISDSTVIIINTDIDSNFDTALKILTEQSRLVPGDRINI